MMENVADSLDYIGVPLRGSIAYFRAWLGFRYPIIEIHQYMDGSYLFEAFLSVHEKKRMEEGFMSGSISSSYLQMTGPRFETGDPLLLLGTKYQAKYKLKSAYLA